MSEPGQDTVVDEVEQILDDDVIWRRVPPPHVIWDANILPDGGWRPSSAAFADPPGSSMSAYVERIVRERGGDENTPLVGHPGFSLVAVKAGFLRSHQFKLVLRPPPPEHIEVVGEKKKSTMRAISKASTWIVLRAPPQAS